MDQLLDTIPATSTSIVSATDGIQPVGEGATILISQEFETWLNELNAEARRRDYAASPITDVAGIDCWQALFEDDLTPAEALDMDETWGDTTEEE